MYSKSESRVLYAEIKKDKNYDILVNATDMIIKKFLEEEILYSNELGFIDYDSVEDKYYVQYHLTLINNSYARIQGEILGFKGIPIVKKFKNEKFGAFKPEYISIFQRKIRNGFYHSELDINV